MLEVFDFNLKKIAILENAYNMREQTKLNALGFLTFSLPQNDRKIKHCRPFYFVRFGTKGQFYRIIYQELSKEGIAEIHYSCEHAAAGLMDNILFGSHTIGNLGIYTREVLLYALGKQPQKRWSLDRCEFNRQFEYHWEQENLLAALFSVATPLADPYIWRFEAAGTQPWKVSLLKLETVGIPEFYIRSRKNLLRLAKTSDLKNICTRLYPLGSGEGVNQLTIKNVNSGVTYLQSPQEYIERYGLIERAWIDRRYENEESLKSAAEAMLKELQEPYVEYSVDYAQLLDGSKPPEVGMRVQIIDTDSKESFHTIIVEVDRSLTDPADCTVHIANKSQDIASSVADLADRQRIEMSYAQGATQLYAQSLQGNASSTDGLAMDFFIPDEMRIVNKVVIKVRMESFRAYSQAASSGGGSVTSTSSGGGTYNSSTSQSGGENKTTSSGGGSYTTTNTSGGQSSTTASGGGNYATTNSGGGITLSNWGKIITPWLNTQFSNGPGSHNHQYQFSIDFPSITLRDHTHGISLPNHSHNFSVSAHSHSVQVPDHYHSFSVSSHSHSFSVSDHSHSINIQPHTHPITPGIYRFGSPSNFQIKVNSGTPITVNDRDYEVDITKMLIRDGKIPRGTWHKVLITPNDLAYISIFMCVQGFVQSRGDTAV